jgi:peptidyl-prolyl cis-trans isomerase SurA
VDNTKDEDQVRQVAENLVRQIRGGASFAAVARQFSQGMGAAQGGDIGWIQQGQLSPELNRALEAASPGQVSAPIRTAGGFHILGVRDKRTISLGDSTKASIGLAQAFHAFVKEDKDALLKEALQVRAAVKSCSTLEATLESFPGWKAQKLGSMNLSKAPAPMAEKVRNVAVGGSSEPLITDKGVVVLFVCDRNDSTGIDRNAIMHSIGTEKLELQARRLQRDLRRKAFIDIRLGKKP